MKSTLKGLSDLVYRKRDTYEVLDETQYLKSFGIVKNKKGKYKAKDRALLEKAYERAWANRDFEINKFWTRAAYFWGFIVLIFGGLITLLTSEHNESTVNLRLDLYLVALGLIFSLAWYLVILGSKSWQENWEAHIDHLENFVSGPIYKTIHYKGKRFYSVSKINEILALLVIIMWLALFIQYYIQNFDFTMEITSIDIQASLTFVITVIFSFSLRFGYSLGRYKAKKSGFLNRWS
ncbi:hypothetical protein [Cellulophaga sp. Z1A5H]|uniref:RipA family octameric membrane protein n=1 Tax=Cellulophaga sp. Z1A5H TaxID=2687291 RepID=UPI0013FD5FE8|nr:hypothetical protein [Cellulophaga sp. Z1A5H]